MSGYYSDVIAPQPGDVGNKQTARGHLLRNTLAVSALIFAALEFWRPYFFLTDDNLDGALPFFSEVGRNLLAGRSPFISEHLFGGGYDLLRDPTFFFWHPFYLLSSLLVGTPFHFAILDVDAFALFMLTTAGFVLLAEHLRREMALKISNGWIMFYTLSYTYSMISLVTGASWFSFLGNHSALPWLALGILQRAKWRGLGLVVIFSLHQILGGHLSPTVSSSIFLSLFALGVGITRRSIQPLGNWLVGYTIAVVLLLPMLLPIASGFLASYRVHGVTMEDMQSYNLDPHELWTSLFVGMLVTLLQTHGHIYTTFMIAFAACAASWCLFPAMANWRKWTGLEVVCVILLVFIAVLICRPLWVTKVMLQLPLFRSMRWPFRELVQFQFFLHLFLVLHPPGLSKIAQKTSAWWGALVLIVPMALFPLPPTLNAMYWDRELLFTGGFDRYWEQVRPLLKPGDRIAVIIPLDIYEGDRFNEPYSLFGTYNYATMIGVVNAWGYSSTVPRDQVYTKTYAYYPYGAYHPLQKAALMAEKPDLKFITLISLKPLKFTLSSRDGPTIDLAPYVPPRIHAP